VGEILKSKNGVAGFKNVVGITL